MGTEFSVHREESCTEEELKKRFISLREDLRDRYGSDQYNGKMSQSRGLTITSKVFENDEVACDWLDSNAEKWGYALAVKVGTFKPLFPVTATDKKLVSTFETLKKDLENFDIDVAKRAKAQKSAKKTCVHCASVINLKHLDVPNNWKAQRYSDFASAVVFTGEYYITSMRKLTDCPVCGKNLLLTDTDKKRKENMRTKLKDLRDKVIAARMAYDAKMKDKQGYWLIGANCGC